MIYTGLRPTELLEILTENVHLDEKYLINNKFGNHYTYGTYMNGNFNTCMGKLKMKHLPHDADTPLLHSWIALEQILLAEVNKI